MKTLKKVLSLVLVVAMIASMLIVGAAASEETNYPEAVAVVTGLGIIEGDESGMNFGGNVTREQAAKIIAYLLLGAETADSLKTGTAPFADVAANRWSAGYIAYLKGQGIISGVSETEFDPTANVTGVAFAKMLLTAVGYGKAGEFEGAAWDINTITLANQKRVFEGTVAADLAAAATREDAMLYAFNTLANVATVNYNKTFEAYYVGTSPLQEVEDESIYTLGAMNYKLSKQAGTGADDFGRPASSWVANGKILATDVASTTPTAVLYGKVTSGTIYDTIGKAAAEELNKTMISYVGADGKTTYYSNEKIAVYCDGALQADAFQPLKAGYLTGEISGNGATVELYLNYNATDLYTLTIVVSYEHVGKVTKVDTTNNELTINGAVAKVDGDVVDITGIAKNDYVIYTEGATAVASVRLAEPVVGTYSGTDFMGDHLIDGVGHKINAKASVSLEPDVAYSVIYDALGTILMVEEYDSAAASGVYDYVYVADVEAEGASNSLIDGAAAKVALYVVYPEGGSAIVDYAVKYNASKGYYYITLNGTNFELNAANIAAINDGTALVSVDGTVTANIGGWMSYIANDEGALSLKTIDGNNYAAVATADLVVTANKATTGTGYTANSKTVLTVVDTLGNATVYNGIANFPNLNTGDNGSDTPADPTDDITYSVLVTHAKGDKLAKNIIVYTSAAAPTSPVYAYVVMSWGTSAAGTTYFAYVDGMPQFITVDSSNDGLLYKMYEVAIWTVDAGVNTLTATDMGLVRNTWGFNMDPNTFATTYWESSIINTIDDNYFTTTPIAADDWADSELSKGFLASYYPGYYEGDTYYYDANTVIYDCVTGGIVTELTEGSAFYAICDANASNVYDDPNYCTHIWIVG